MTRSSRFFVDALSRTHEVVELESGAWSGGTPISALDVDTVGADVAVFWQALPWPSELLKLRTPAVWVPMYDTAARRANRLFWRVIKERNVRVVSFCRALSRTIARQGIPVIDCTYYPDPSATGTADCSDELRVFLWDRGEVGFERLKSLLGDQAVAETILRLSPDPGLRASRPPPSTDLARYHVRVVTGPLPREEHLRLMARCNVFLAPRELEGIGLANLEAMAMGLAVVAPDRPTMNEYITHGVNGYLYDSRRPHAVGLRAAPEVGRRARADVSRGHTAWLEAQTRILTEALAAFPEPRASKPGAAAAARALTTAEQVKARIPPGPRAVVARALRFYRP